MRSLVFHCVTPGFCVLMKELDLLSLPTSIFCAVLGNLNKVALVRLDSAYCHHHYREIWLELLKCKQFTLTRPVNLSFDNELSWVLDKSIKCSSLMFTEDIKAYKNVSDFLREMGGFVRSVFFGRDTKSHEVVLVAMFCKNLTKATVHGGALSCAMREVLLQNTNLQQFCCSSVKCSEEDIFAGVALHRLQTMYITDSNCLKGFPWHQTAFSDSLQKVVWSYCVFRDEDLKALLNNCPQIRSFCADDMHWNTYENIVNLGMGIVNLSLYGNTSLTDAHVLSIVTRLSSLRTLNIQRCPLLTDRILRHIADHAGDRLEVLYVDIKFPDCAETEDILEDFSQKCTKLKYLNINCYNTVLCSGKGTSLIVGGCPRLETLVVDKYTTIGASSRGLISRFRPELKVLVHSTETTFNILSMSVD